MSIKNLSVTAASNNAAAPNGAPEGMTIASVNDTMRQTLAEIRTLAAPSTIAAAATTDIGTKDETFLTLTGTAVTITALGTVSAGIYKAIIYNAAHTLTHNATSLILLSGANRTVVAGNVSFMLSEGAGNWRELFYGSATAASLALTGGTMTGDIIMSGAAIEEAHGADIASAATINLSTSTGNLVDVTGVTTITAITLGDGAERTVRFTGILTLTENASIILPGGASITTAAGDFAVFRGYAAGVVRCVSYIKKSGAAVVVAAITQTILQVVNATPYTANADLATTTPQDDTTPTSAEGNEILTANITPADNTNKVLIIASGNWAGPTAIFAVALFRGTTCIAVEPGYCAGPNGPETWAVSFLDSPASAAAQTYSVRIGSSGTGRCNGTTAGRLFGGVSACTMQLLEVNA